MPNRNVVAVSGIRDNQRRMKSIVVAGIILVAVLLSIAAIAWAWDVRSDRKHTVLITAPTPIYSGTGSEICGGSRVLIASKGTSFRAERIRYWKNCATIDVNLLDGRHGYIVLGDGAAIVSPQLN